MEYDGEPCGQYDEYAQDGEEQQEGVEEEEEQPAQQEGDQEEQQEQQEQQEEDGNWQQQVGFLGGGFGGMDTQEDLDVDPRDQDVQLSWDMYTYPQ